MVDFIKRQINLLTFGDSGKSSSNATEKAAPPFQFTPCAPVPSPNGSAPQYAAVAFPKNRGKRDGLHSSLSEESSSSCCQTPSQVDGGKPPQSKDAEPQPQTSTGSSAAAQSIITQVAQGQDQAPPRLPVASPFAGGFPPEPEPNSFIPLLPPKEENMRTRNTLVLDLDETLVHSSFKPLPLTDFMVKIVIEGEPHEVSVRKRPYVDSFLARMSELYEVVVLTASMELYADPVLDHLDLKRVLIHHRLFRDSCANLNGTYIKDLSFLGRPLHTVIIIDNSPTSYLFQPRNALPITSWFDDSSDTELRDLTPVLEQAAKAESIYATLDAHKLATGSPQRSSPTCRPLYKLL
eukprot:RCo053506